jgi:transcription-repair coupling factor (superfamily II helicase)
VALKQFISGAHSLEALIWKMSRDPALSVHRKWIVPSVADALEMRDIWSSLHPKLPCVLFLPLETDVIRNRGPSLRRRVERLRALSMAASSNTSYVWIECAEAWAGPLPNLSVFRSRCFSLRVGDSLDREELSRKLHQLGYLPTDLVEQPLQHAVRGSIVDCFPPSLDHPLRVELFGDEVQSLRLFQAQSQRRIGELEEITLSPAREFFFAETSEQKRELRSKLRLYLDEKDFSKSDRDAVLSRMDQGSVFPTLDYWSPLIDPPAFDSLDSWLSSRGPPEPGSLAILEAQTIRPQLSLHRRSVEKNFAAGRLEGEWLPDPSDYMACCADAQKSYDEVSARAGLWASRKEVSIDVAPERSHVPLNIRSVELLCLELNSHRSRDNPHPIEPLVAHLEELQKQASKLIVTADSVAPLERLQFLLQGHSWGFRIVTSLEEAISDSHTLVGFVSELSNGFVDPAEKITLLTTSEIFGTPTRRHRKKARAQTSSAQPDLALVGLKVGDAVVHKHHGIGRYLGTRSLSVGTHEEEFLEIEYRDQHKLLLPVTRLNLIQKHSSAAEQALDRLGGSTWENKKERVKRELQSMAGELLNLYSLREMSEAPPIVPDEVRVAEFAAAFAFEETPDQAKAIAAVLTDLSLRRPMDRLICGDVGYGKTEVALRAAHAAASAGFQVAVLVPTTILAAQHELSFKRRLEPFGIQVASVSRFKSPAEVKSVIESLRTGKTQVLIGTHRALNPQFSFKNLGLLVIDEEQRFGVAHKEKIKKMRNNVHVLSMTATPIPRTLNMAMGGLKELSIMNTAPVDRLSVRTFVARRSDKLISEAIRTELQRGGQVFYVHNRIETQMIEFERIQRNLPPGASLDFVHGQMDEEQLESKMLSFYSGKTQVLLTTAIVESGLDVPNANTILVNRADGFGLAQLYQLRGRVGRSTQRGYAYFMLPESGTITADAEERLAVLETYQELGSGFQIASHDLEIRGAGDLLGRSQSGFIASLGFETYVELLQQCVAELKGQTLETPIDPELQLEMDLTIPEHYLPDQGQRLLLYRRLSAAPEEAEVSTLAEEVSDRFGPPPESVKNLFVASKIKCQLRRLRVTNLKSGKSGYSVSFDSQSPVRAEDLIRAVSKYPQHFQALPDGRLLIRRPLDKRSEKDPSLVLRGVEIALTELESWC